MSYKTDAVQIMLRKAKGKLKMAGKALEEKELDSCVSDLYYAAFQSVLALMILIDVTQSKHQLARQWVNKELAQKGLISIEQARMYNKLMDARDDADYKTTVVFELKDVTDIYVEVDSFVSTMVKIIEKEGIS